MTGLATSTSRSGKTTGTWRRTEEGSTWWRTEEGGTWWRTEEGGTWWRTEEGGSWWRTEEGEETGLAVLLQVMFPFLMAGVGMVCAGFVFDFIVAWPVFKISEIIIMIP